ncbi:MAG: thiol-disulfide oxidoreductase DCC family protein [Bacteroidota bacterium]
MAMKNDVILFDGVCNLCNSSVNFVIDRDKGRYFKFAALQSEAGQELLSSLGQPTENFDSIVLVSNGKIYKKSRAALEVARKLRGLWPLLYVFMIVPWFIRNPIYDLIAKNRYRWFGKSNECRMPTPELKQRFLDSTPTLA